MTDRKPIKKKKLVTRQVFNEDGNPVYIDDQYPPRCASFLYETTCDEEGTK